MLHTKMFAVAGLLIACPLFMGAQDLETYYQSLQGAVAKKDVATVKKLAGETSAKAREELATPMPDGADKDAFAKRQKFVKDIDKYSEYALYTMAVQSPAETQIDLFVTLEAQNPKSQYLDEGFGAYLVALTQAGKASTIPAVAEKALKNLPDQEDLLLYMADAALRGQRMPQCGAYAERLLVALAKAPKPETIPAADWEKKKTMMRGRAHWMAGMAHAARQDFVGANQDLRAALPLISGVPEMTASALFQLGIANYQLGRQSVNRAQILEGAKFSEQCAAIPGQYQQQAWTNAHAMKKEADAMVARKR
jgi:hypothetical protein